MIAAATRDMTERYRSERETSEARALAETKLARFQTVLDTIDEGVVLIGPNGRFLKPVEPAELIAMVAGLVPMR